MSLCGKREETAIIPGTLVASRTQFNRDVALAIAPQLLATPAAVEFVVPDWAYPVDPPAIATSAAPSDDGMLLRVPGSRVELTRSQVTDLFAAPDCHPESPPPMPAIVARGRKPQVHACRYCHLPDGQVRPENAPLAGLPAACIAADAEVAEAARSFIAISAYVASLDP